MDVKAKCCRKRQNSIRINQDQGRYERDNVPFLTMLTFTHFRARMLPPSHTCVCITRSGVFNLHVM